MIALTLSEIADCIGVPVPLGSADVVIRNVEFDTRRLRPDSLFVAMAGQHVDGHDFAVAAADAGAVAVLGSREIAGNLPLLRVADNEAVLTALAAVAHRSVTALIASGLTVVGVTGSSGKTSTKDLLAAVLTAFAGPDAVVAPPGSFNNELGHPYTVLRATEATRYLVLELSARGPGHIAALAATAPPQIGAVLNVGTAHLGEFGSVAMIAQAKGELVEALPPAAAGGIAILNADDSRVLAMADRTTAAVVTVGSSANAQIRAEDLHTDDRARARFRLVAPQGSAAVALQVAGTHQVGNALTAAAAGLAVGMTVQAVADALSAAVPASRWRMEITERSDGVVVINDAYNANPDSMKAALRSLASIGEHRRTWAVLGEMAELGAAAREAHDEIGRLAVRLGVDRLIVVGERARALHLGAHLEGSWNGESELVPDVAAAVRTVLAELAPGDVLLVKASRSAGLEKVAEAVLASDPEVPGTRSAAAPEGIGTTEQHSDAETREHSVKSILVAAIVGLVVSILLTPYLIKVFSRQGFGQEIRDDGPQTHLKKRGTPTMGGTAILIAMWAGYAAAILVQLLSDGGGPTASGLLLLYLTTGLGVVGVLDDYIKIRKQRSLGLNKRAKLIGQTFIAVSFAVLALMFRTSGRSGGDLSPASTHLSYTRDLSFLSFGVVGFVIIAVLIIAAWSNAVNFTDGLDGLAAGSSVMVLGTYVFICFYEFRNSCANLGLSAAAQQGCYQVRDPLDIAVVAAGAMGGCIGFLWWNAHPARIFMGDSGSLALGGLVAGLSILSRTELLMVVVAGLAVVEMLSVVLQMLVYKARKVRIFKMAPFHHHFEVGGWTETTVMVRFWLLALMSAALGAALFYADWLARTGA